MPQINRVRIINFTYNNDKRRIIDEMFNFYGGENALLSLKNGGGKSVLIQLMMQPVIPMVKIQGRSIKDFFKKKKTPSFVLIEWKLDDKGGYLVTGICIANREMQVRENQDTENSIKYFTFTVQYSGSNLFDIENIPFCKKEGNNILILPFKEAAELIQDKSRESKLEIAYYPQDEGARYGSDLMSFNISQDEWRNIISKINSDEGGVIEIFEKCKTGQQLMHEWMIKTVEKVIYKDREDHRKLEQMLENLVEEMIGNEQYIHEKSVLEEFKRQIEDFGTAIEDLIKGFDEQKEVENELAAMHHYLNDESSKAIDMIEKNNEEIEKQNRDLRFINLEERSLFYYKWKDEFERLETEHADIKEKLSVTVRNLEETTGKRDIQKAAEIYEEIKTYKRELASIEEEILKVKGEGIEQDRIKSLEYSLKLCFEEKLKAVVELLKKTDDEVKTQEGLITEYEEKDKSLGSDIEKLNREQAVLVKSKNDFLSHEEKIKKALGIAVNRNLFGEADSAELEKNRKMLQNKFQNLVDEKGVLQNNLAKKQERQKEIKLDLARLGHENVDLLKMIDEKTRARELYQKMENELEIIFLRHGLDFKRRFNHEEIQRELRRIIDDLRESQFEFQRELSNTKKAMESLKNGTLHVSEEFLKFLEAKDINFETGENYLRKQDRDLRETLMKNIPLLPYAFVLTDEDIEKLKQTYPENPIYQLIPIISYNSLSEKLETSGKLIGMSRGTSLFCFYNQRMIDADSIDEYFKELEGEGRELAAKLNHYTGLLEEAQKDLITADEFKFDSGYLHSIETELDRLCKKNKGLEKNMEALEKEYSGLEQDIGKIYQSISGIERRIDEAERNIKLFEEYLDLNKCFEENVKKHSECTTRLKSVRQELENIKRLIGEASEAKAGLEVRKNDLTRERTETESKFSRYENAEKAEILDEDIESMEARLETLMSKVTGTLERLEKEKEIRNRDIKRKNRELDGLKLTLSEYENVTFNEVLLEKLETKLQDLNKVKAEQDFLERNVGIEKAKSETKVNTALEEIKKLAESPVERTEIKMNFEIRRKDCRRVIDDKEKETAQLERKNRLYQKTMTDIEGSINIGDFSSSREYVLRIGVKEDFDTFSKELKSLKHVNGSHEKVLSGRYIRMVNEYKDKNPNIANIFKGLDPIWQQAEEDPENYYYLYERTAAQKDVLGDMIRIYENQLANLERNKNDMVTQSYLHAVQIYEEVQKITRDSSIKLSGKSRPVSMLRINMVPPEEGSRSMDKVRGYIESCVALVKDDMKKDKKKEEIRRNINKYMSSWELLNVISDLSKLVIEAYKIDINMNNSQYKTWEQVMKENSGGERFVSFFAVLAALMSYTRTSGRDEDDYVRNKDTKVLIMDNPFGPISSEHLLRPLFEIAKKYNTQMICLTDLKQNSILNCFNLIYMLKIRTSTFGTNEYLKVEEQIREGAELEKDENLEKAVFKAEDFEQMTFI